MFEDNELQHLLDENPTQTLKVVKETVATRLGSSASLVAWLACGSKC